MKLGRPQQVYVIHNTDFNITKVGISNHTEGRRQTLENEAGCSMEIKWTSDFIADALLYERKIHETLDKYRRKGEWFDLSPEEAIRVAREITAPAERATIVIQYNQGKSISQLALDNNVSRQAIIQKLKTLGVYKKNEIPYEVNPMAPRNVRPTIDNQNLKPIQDSPINKTIREEQPTKLPSNLKRIEPNISSNGEWFQVSLYKNGEFFHVYTRSIETARNYIEEEGRLNAQSKRPITR